MASSSRSAPAPAAVVAAAVATTRDKPVPDPVPGLFADPPAIGEFASPYQLPLARTIYDPRVLALARCGGLHLASRRAPAGLAFSHRWLYAFAVAVSCMPIRPPVLSLQRGYRAARCWFDCYAASVGRKMKEGDERARLDASITPRPTFG